MSSENAFTPYLDADLEDVWEECKRRLPQIRVSDLEQVQTMVQSRMEDIGEDAVDFDRWCTVSDLLGDAIDINRNQGGLR